VASADNVLIKYNMITLLAQTPPPTSTGVWAAVGGMVVMIIGAAGTQALNYYRYKRETEDRQADAALNTQIRDCLKQIEIGNTEHHGTILLALKDTCKATCDNYKPKQQKET
jgi:hypothetical protein